MSKIKDFGEGRYSFYCPGCKQSHIYFVNSPHWTKDSPGWTFNGDMDRPTFEPSLLNTWGKYAKPDFVEDPDFPNSSGRCHLFVRNGIIEYCGDCTHELNGQGVEMVELGPEGWPLKEGIED